MKTKIAIAVAALLVSSVGFAKGNGGKHGGGMGASQQGAAACGSSRGAGKHQGLNRIDLSDEQKAKIEALRTERRNAVQSGAAPREKGALHNQIREILTPEQQKQLDAPK